MCVWKRHWKWYTQSCSEIYLACILHVDHFRISWASKEFACALDDILFIVNSSDKTKVDARLNSERSSCEKKLKYHPKSLWPLDRRTIPPPKDLYKTVEALFKTYGPLMDATTGQPLFTAAVWKSEKSVLNLTKASFHSDSPGIPLYYKVGLDQEENGLPVWHI